MRRLAPADRGLRLRAWLLALWLPALAACDEAETPERPVVVVSVPPQAHLVERLAGERVQLHVMVPPGTSPATHEPTIEQMRAVGQASLYVKVGHPSFPFERAWLDRLLEQGEGVRVVDCSEGIATSEGDPHVWVSPKRVRTMVPRIAEALADLLPDARAELERRRKALLAEVDALDAELQRRLGALERKTFYVFHAAWGYLARDYGLEQVAIEHGGKEPDPRALAATLDGARMQGVRTVFVQPQFSDASAELVADEIDARVVVLDPLARDWDDNLRRTAKALEEAASQ